jgi:hypothetical protein
VNAPVLADASRVIIEAHNGCAGLAYFYKDNLEKLIRQGNQTPYFEIQRQLLERGIRRFAGRVAALSKQDLLVEANYVDFGSGGSVADVTSICRVQFPGTGQGRKPAVLQPGDFQGTPGRDDYTWT